MNYKVLLQIPKPFPGEESCLFHHLVDVEGVIGGDYVIRFLPNSPSDSQPLAFPSISS